MDTNQTTASPILTPPPPSAGIFGTRIPSAVAFAAGILLFLLPMAEIKCSSTTIANNTGLRIAMGKDWQPVGGGLFNQNDLQQKSVSATKEQKGQTQYFAIAALGLGVLGLLFSF